jgi:hypothetical protein
MRASQAKICPARFANECRMALRARFSLSWTPVRDTAISQMSWMKCGAPGSGTSPSWRSRHPDIDSRSPTVCLMAVSDFLRMQTRKAVHLDLSGPLNCACSMSNSVWGGLVSARSRHCAAISSQVLAIRFEILFVFVDVLLILIAIFMVLRQIFLVAVQVLDVCVAVRPILV